MEREEGHFDNAGNYVEDRFKISQRDAWLDEVQDKYAHGLVKTIKKAAVKEDDSMEEKVDHATDLKFLHDHLQDGETVARALKRIGAIKDDESRKLFNALTECADRLLAGGYHNVFTDARQAVHARILAGAEPDTAEDDGRTWEYQIEDEVAPRDPKKMTVKELRAYLDSRGISHQGYVEKDELIAKVRQIMSRPNIFGPCSDCFGLKWRCVSTMTPPAVILVACFLCSTLPKPFPCWSLAFSSLQGFPLSLTAARLLH